MIINLFFTNGMYKWGELFIRSFNNFHPDIDIIACTCDLKEKQIKFLENFNCEVINQELNYKELAKKINISIKKLLEMKKQTEKGKTDDRCQPWKWLIAGGKRIEALHEIVKKHYKEGVIHFDADTYIRNDISSLFKAVKKYDVCMIQKKHPVIWKRAIISLMGFKGKNALTFFDKWNYHLSNVDINNTHKTFDQATCYYAIKDLKNEINIGNLLNEEIPKISSYEEKDADIWYGNILDRTYKIKKFWRDYEKKMGSIN